jgi:hypothetical protein
MHTRFPSHLTISVQFHVVVLEFRPTTSPSPQRASAVANVTRIPAATFPAAAPRSASALVVAKYFPYPTPPPTSGAGGADDDVDGSRFRCSGQGPRVRQRGREGGHPRAKPADASAILLRPATAAGWTRLSAHRPPLFVSPGARGLLASLSHRLGFPGAWAHAAFAGTGLCVS